MSLFLDSIIDSRNRGEKTEVISPVFIKAKTNGSSSARISSEISICLFASARELIVELSHNKLLARVFVSFVSAVVILRICISWSLLTMSFLESGSTD